MTNQQKTNLIISLPLIIGSFLLAVLIDKFYYIFVVLFFLLFISLIFKKGLKTESLSKGNSKIKQNINHKTDDIAINNFKKLIQEHEDQLFGINLFIEGIKRIYGHDEKLMRMNEQAYLNIIKKEKKALSKAKQLLDKVRSGTVNITEIQNFHFPPIHGPGLDQMTNRVTLLVNAYEKLFPKRPREIPLSTEDYEKIMHEAIDKL